MVKNSKLELLLSAVCKVSYSRANEFLDNGVIRKDRDEFVTIADGKQITVDADSIRSIFHLPQGGHSGIFDHTLISG